MWVSPNFWCFNGTWVRSDPERRLGFSELLLRLETSFGVHGISHGLNWLFDYEDLIWLHRINYYILLLTIWLTWFVGSLAERNGCPLAIAFVAIARDSRLAESCACKASPRYCTYKRPLGASRMRALLLLCLFSLHETHSLCRCKRLLETRCAI